MARGLDRDLMARAHLPVAGSALALISFAVGFYSSFDSNRDSLPYYRGEVVRIALVWGLVFAAILLIAGLIGVFLGRGVNRRRMRRLFPTGSVTQVRLDRDALVLTRPGTTRTIPYGRIRRVKLYEHTQWIMVRGRPLVEVLPAGLLPDEAVETLQARASGAVPLSWSPPATGPARQMVVPAGWATHVAGVDVRNTLSKPRFWVRLGLAILVSTPIAYAAGTAWLALGPALALLSSRLAYVRTRDAMAASMPSGSVARLEVLDDRMVSRTARWAREIRFDEVREVHIRGDVVFLAMTTTPPRLALARELLPDVVIDRLRGGAR
jgi:hypothetical protein